MAIKFLNNVAVDTSVLYVDTINDRVGIGTTSPSEKLHVVGSALIEGSSTELKVKGSGSYDTANIVMGNAAKSDSFSIDTRNDPGGNYTTLSFDSYQTTGTSTITLGDNYVNLGTAGSSRVTINSTGNVGIGTTSPNNKLHVDGNGNSIYAIFSRASTKWMYLHSGSVDPAIGWDTAGDLRFGTSTSNVGGGFSEKMRIDSSGNVGIGTTSPSEKLEVSGKILATGGQVRAGSYLESFPSFSFANDTDTGMFSDTANQLEFATGGSSRVTINSSGNVGIGTTSPDALLDIGVNNIITLDDTGSSTGFIGMGSYNDGTKNRAQGTSYYGFGLEIDRPNQNISFNSYDSNGALTAGTNILVLKRTGNVGIGTASPVTKLQVDAGSNIASFRSVGSGQNNKELLIQTGGDRVVLDAKNADDGTATSLAFELGNSEKARLTTTGLGIGTTSPGHLLEVRGTADALSVGDDSNTNTYARFANDRTYFGYLSSGNAFMQGGNSKGISFHTGSSTLGANERMRITSTGNVGIGTTSPSTPLEVNVTGNNTVFSLTRDTGTNGELTVDFDGANANFDSLQGGYTFQTNSNERMRIDSSGRVGIGLTPYTTSSLLNLKGDGLALKNDENGSNNNWSLIQNLATGNTSSIDFTSGQGLAMTIAHNKNVGIGTTSPATKLQVGSGSADDAARVYFSDGSYTEMRGYGLQFNRTTSYIRPTADNTSSLNIGSGSATWNTLITDASTTIFRVNASEKMRITSAGNVGIGTTSPDTKLHVEGNLLVDAYNQGEDNGIFLREGFLTIDQPSITVWDMSNSGASPDGLSINANDGIRFRENGGEVARFKDGNFGIGDISPGAKLVIAQPQITSGGFSTPFIELKSTAQTNNTGLVAMSFSTSTADNYGYSIGALRGSSGGASSFVISHHNNSSTGTIRMRINSDSVNFNTPYVRCTNNSTDYAQLESNVSGGVFKAVSNGNTNILFRSYGNSYTLNNFGVGMLTPEARLHVDHPTTTAPSLTFGEEAGQIFQNENSEFAFGLTSASPYPLWIQGRTSSNTARNINLQPNGGNIGITQASPSHKLHVNGNIMAGRYYGSTSTIYYLDPNQSGDSIRVVGDIVAYYSSDKRYKENIKPIESPIEKVKAISGVTFEWNEKSHKETGKKDVGVIAQEVEEVLPEIVQTRDNGYKAVDYQKLTAVLIEAVKDQQKQIDELKSIINGSP